MPIKDPEKRKAYGRAHAKARYTNDPVFRATVCEKVGNRRKQRRLEIGKLMLEFRKNGCLLCQEKASCCLVAHHINPEQKEFNLRDARLGSLALERVAKELSKCVCLCENCHRKVHAGVRALPPFQMLVA
jgi:transcription elongation factor Elf1